jgi:predicted dehydrogenase/threonine dehydrogenase-like Zn-dependent dehydrogenase
MKQLIQHLKTGNTQFEDVPVPAVKPGYILIRSKASLISTGTEKMLVEFSKANLINKARQNPDRVAQVIDKIKTDGLMPTLDAVFRRLDEPLPLGYCNVGTVIALGEGVTEFKIGDRVANNGPHAEFVCVPKNLAALIPDNVTDTAATCTVLGSIGLEAIRLATPQIGDTVVVVGLGLIGLITCQLLKASGCTVIAFDIDDNKIQLAETFGVEAFNSTKFSIQTIAAQKTGNIGFDAVFITASAKDDSIINESAASTKKRGKVILVGVVDMHLDRASFYKNEVQFQVSCSYGPGRYDEQYEQKGIDYPEAYVKWTAKRNFETILKLLANGQLKTDAIINQIIPFKEAIEVYASISTNTQTGTILLFDEETPIEQSITVTKSHKKNETIVAGIIGAGNFSKITLLPALKKTNITIKYICGNDGLDTVELAKKYQIQNAVTDHDLIIHDPEVNLVIIATRHDSHAKLTAACLAQHKHVFVEKPLALNREQLDLIKNNYNSDNYLFVGFNRRFAPTAIKAKSLLPPNAPINVIMTINAGKLPEGHWLYDNKNGGGRIIGEACHFFDLMSYFTGSAITSVFATEAPVTNQTENTIIHLKYANGSHGTIHYLSNGSKKYPKEKIEIFAADSVIVIDNFKSINTYGTRKSLHLPGTQDKGHEQQFKTMTHLIQTGGAHYNTFESLINTTLATFAVDESISSGNAVQIL